MKGIYLLLLLFILIAAATNGIADSFDITVFSDRDTFFWSNDSTSWTYYCNVDKELEDSTVSFMIVEWGSKDIVDYIPEIRFYIYPEGEEVVTPTGATILASGNLFDMDLQKLEFSDREESYGSGAYITEDDYPLLLSLAQTDECVVILRYRDGSVCLSYNKQELEEIKQFAEDIIRSHLYENISSNIAQNDVFSMRTFIYNNINPNIFAATGITESNIITESTITDVIGDLNIIVPDSWKRDSSNSKWHVKYDTPDADIIIGKSLSLESFPLDDLESFFRNSVASLKPQTEYTISYDLIKNQFDFCASSPFLIKNDRFYYLPFSKEESLCRLLLMNPRTRTVSSNCLKIWDISMSMAIMSTAIIVALYMTLSSRIA